MWCVVVNRRADAVVLPTGSERGFVLPSRVIETVSQGSG
jgi:hypothetical protein